MNGDGLAGGDRAGRLVIGLGNRYRGDDVVGLEIASRIRDLGLPSVAVLEAEGEPSVLLDAWSGAGTVFVVDAIASGGPPGTIHRFDAIGDAPPARFAQRGTHALSLAEVIELTRALGRLPDQLVVYGIEGGRFEAGTSLSDPVEQAADVAVGRLVAELARGVGEGA